MIPADIKKELACPRHLGSANIGKNCEISRFYIQCVATGIFINSLDTICIKTIQVTGPNVAWKTSIYTKTKGKLSSTMS